MSFDIRGFVRRSWVGISLALVAYIPLLLTAPGQISADTKAYLYLDPGRLLSRAGTLWDTHIAAGTVTHQNIGYLFPMGPYYWLCDAIGMPMWIAERLWFGSLLFAAGLGTVWMLRRLGLRGAGTAVAGFTYMLSPYLLAYFGRTSVILLPWAALPWLIGLTAMALRERTWRAPAIIGIVVTLMAGTNASSVVFVLLGPALLVPFMIWGTREVTPADALKSIGRAAVTTAPAQLWWVAGLWVQGKYGLPILQLTESVETVAQTSTAPELLRGLGYWYFYGRDGLAQWTNASTLYTQNPGMIAFGFILPVLGLCAAMLTRWRYRAFFVALILMGLVLGIGTYPYDAPAPFGWLVKLTTSSEAGFALRNSPRAVPLLLLGMAALLAALVQSVDQRLQDRSRSRMSTRARVAIPVALIAIAILGLPPLWRGQLVQPDLQFPETLPSYWTDAAASLDSAGTDTRVLELPGSDFYAYRWGETQDPITPGLIDRPWVGRELTAFGSPASADLIRAIDRRLQDGTSDPAGIAPIARFFSASDVLLRLDTQYERFRGPRPADLFALFGAYTGTDGLGVPRTFGTPAAAQPDQRQPTLDEQELARVPGTDEAPPLAIYPVTDARSLLRAEPTRGSLVIWGDGEGFVDAAEFGLLPRNSSVLYAATLAAHPLLQGTVLSGTPSLLVTDTNRKRAQRWGTIRENSGATEVAGSLPLVVDPKDARLEVFPGQLDSMMTVADFGPDVADVQASSYGNIVAYSAEARPINAIDDDPRTAWSTGGYSDVIGDKLRITYRRPISADHLDLTQLRGNRYITRVSIYADGRRVASASMTDASFSEPGQTVRFGATQTFSTLEIRIDSANISGLNSYVGISNVGFRSVIVPGTSATEWIRVPDESRDTFVDAASSNMWLFTRWRANPIEGYRQDPELRLARIYQTPKVQTFRLTGAARINGRTEGSLVDSLIGRPGLSAGYPIVSGTAYLDGDLRARPSSALDGDLATTWITNFGNQTGNGFTVTNPTPVTVDHLNLAVVADGRHSVPTQISLTLDDGSVRTVSIPVIADNPVAGSVTSVYIPFEPFVSSTIRMTITGEREVLTREYFSRGNHALPIAIAELGLPRTVAPMPTAMPTGCRSGLASIDGSDIPVRISGTVADAIDRKPLDLNACDSVSSDAGEHRLLTGIGLDTGFDVDRILLGTGDAALADTAEGAPQISINQTGDLSWTAEISAASGPFWLVLGQSLSPGWTATVVGGESLGEPVLIDGFANGWLVDPTTIGSDFTVKLVWTPQKVVWTAVAASSVWFLGVCVLAFVTSRRRRRAFGNGADDVDTSDDEQRPVFLDPRAALLRPSTRAGIGVATASMLLSGAVGGVTVGLATGAVVALAAFTRRGRWALLAAPITTLGMVVVIYVGLQVRRRLQPGVEWPSGFGPVHQLALIATFCVVSETLLRFAARKWPRDE